MTSVRLAKSVATRFDFVAQSHEGLDRTRGTCLAPAGLIRSPRRDRLAASPLLRQDICGLITTTGRRFIISGTLKP
jgi:hypothetical protein